jgi:hypothetical protein
MWRAVVEEIWNYFIYVSEAKPEQILLTHVG